jgi:hypothetical protein
MDVKKISQIKPLYKNNSKVTSKSADILANYVASLFQWHICYGILCARGNPKKDSVTKAQQLSQFHASSDTDDSNVNKYVGITYMDFEPSERTLRIHFPGTNIQSKSNDTTKESYSAKRMKQEDSPIEDFYKGYVECSYLKIDLPAEDFSENKIPLKE